MGLDGLPTACLPKARAVETEKAVNLAEAHAQRNVVNRKHIAEAFRESVGFDCEFHAMPFLH
jgi:hypothetical protein